jgi:Tol biopolymer transport system component/DNA-binding winged helix-turn-helix (wHTH) protein
MLEQTPTRLAKIRFGVFETDLRAGELRKCGIRIKLQSQPFKLLAILLSHPGEIVTREELQQQIWGSETVVNFDHSLGTAVNKVREALGDSAENPRYIETLAKRGYRFVAPVELLDTADSPASPKASLAIEACPVPQVQPPTVPAPTVQPPATVVVPDGSRRDAMGSRIPTVVAIVAIVTGLGLRLWESAATVKPTLLPFTQITSSDSIFPGDVGVERFPALLTDGSRLYFSKIENGRVALAYSPISGGDAHPLITPPEIGTPRLADISPDGAKLLVFGETLTELERTMWVVPSVGGAARKIVSGLGHDGTWMPDGNTILYASGRSILITHDDGRDARLLTSVPGRAFWLRCAPDGSRLRFTVIDSATRATSLWEYTFEDKKLRPLLPGWSNPTSECCGNWTPDGKSFVFQSNRPEGSNIWMLPQKSWIGAAAPVPSQLTAGPLNFIGPVPGRQGNQIFFTGAHKRSQLRRYDSATHQFLPYLREIGMAGRTVLSGDGTRVAWVSTSDGGLWQSRLDGTHHLQLTSRPMRVFMMRWSPDARSIAFMGKEPGKTWKIYSISTEGGQPQTVSEEVRSQADPDWSPDGKAIVYGRPSEYMAEDSTPKSIQTVDLTTKVISIVPGSEGLFSPRWSPDGRYLIAMSLDQRKLMIFDIASKKWTQLASGTFNNPVWSKDGKDIYYQSYDEGSPIYRMRVASGKVEEVADFRDLQPGATVGYWGLAAEDAPIVSFHFLTADIYSVDLTRR